MSERAVSRSEKYGIACAGNWILDTVHTISHWPEKSGLALISSQHMGLGGGPANVAAGLKAMNVPYPVLPIGLIGAGASGDEVLRLCREAGLPLEGISRTSKATTSQTHVMNLPGDSRTFFHHPGANNLLDASSINVDQLSDAGLKILYLGYLTLLEQLDTILSDGRSVAAQILAEARDRGIMTCVDLASTKTGTYRHTVEATLPAIDYLFANEIEAEQATGVVLTDEADADAMMQAARVLKSGGVHRAVIIHSPVQVVWCDDGIELARKPKLLPPEKVVSAVGAGDAFASGVIHGIHEDWPAEGSIEFGMRAAAACLSGYTSTDGLQKLPVPEIAP